MDSWWYMGKTGYLHYRVRLDNNNDVMIQNKHTIDSESWSNPQYIWNVHAPRPEGRECIGKTSGLLCTDLQLAPSKKLKDTHRDDLGRALDNIRPRLTPDEWKKVREVLKVVATRRAGRACKDAIIRFQADDRTQREEPESDEDLDVKISVEVRPTSMWSSQSTQNQARVTRVRRGYAANTLQVGYFVAYTGCYVETFPFANRQECWLGKINELGRPTDDNKNTVFIERWHTNQLKNVTGTNNPG